jgi:hypothetical protein
VGLCRENGENGDEEPVGEDEAETSPTVMAISPRLRKYGREA